CGRRGIRGCGIIPISVSFTTLDRIISSWSSSRANRCEGRCRSPRLYVSRFDTVSPIVRLHYVNYLIPMVRLDEAFAELRLALQDDSLNVGGHMSLVGCYVVTGRLTEAEAEARMVIELDPNSPPPWGVLGLIHWLKGEFDEARTYAEKAY